MLTPTFTRTAARSVAPRFTIPDGEMDPTTAYQIVHDETMLDGNARLNLATFVATWMGDQADRLWAGDSVRRHSLLQREHGGRARSRHFQPDGVSAVGAGVGALLSGGSIEVVVGDHRTEPTSRAGAM